MIITYRNFDVTGSDKTNFSVEIENTSVALLDDSLVVSPKRYPTGELQQFWVVLKRTLLFSRRDWVNIIQYCILFI